MPKLMGGDIPRHVWQRERGEMSGSENDQSSPSKALRVDADRRNVRTIRESNNDISLDAIEALGLSSALFVDHGGAKVPKHLLRQAQGRRNNGTEARRRTHRFQLEVPVPRGFLHGDEALIRRITEYRNRPASGGARSDTSANTTSRSRRGGQNR